MQDSWTSLEKPSTSPEPLVDASPYEPPQASLLDTGNTPDSPQQSYRVPLATIAVIAIVFFITGIGDGLFSNQDFYQGYYLASVCVIGILSIVWYHQDCRFLGRTPSKAMAVGIFLVGIFAIPIHLFRSRRAGRAMVGTLLFLGFFILCIALMSLGTILIVGWDEFLAMS